MSNLWPQAWQGVNRHASITIHLESVVGVIMSENIGSLYGEIIIKSNISEEVKKAIGLLDAYGNAWNSTSTKVTDSASKMDNAGAKLIDGMNSIGKSAVSVALGMVGAGSIMQAMQTVTNLMVGGYNEARELSRANVQLTAALGYQSTALRMQRDLLDENLGIEKQEIAVAQLRLANYVKDEEQIKRLIPAVLDLAKAKGMDLAMAADLVARGIYSDTGELSRFKIAVEGSAGSVERISSVMDGLTAKFGGQAKAVKDNMNALERMSKAIKDFFRDQFVEKTPEELLDRKIKQLETEADIIRKNQNLGYINEDPRNLKDLESEIEKLKQKKVVLEETQKAEIEESKVRAAEEEKRLKSVEATTERLKKVKAYELELEKNGEKEISDLDQKLAEDQNKNRQQQAQDVKAYYDEKLKLADESAKKIDDLEKKGAESTHLLDVEELEYKIKYYEDLSQNASYSEDQRLIFAIKASDERKRLLESEAQWKKDKLDEEYAILAGNNEDMRAQIEAIRDKLKENIEIQVKLAIAGLTTIPPGDSGNNQEKNPDGTPKTPQQILHDKEIEEFKQKVLAILPIALDDIVRLSDATIQSFVKGTMLDYERLIQSIGSTLQTIPNYYAQVFGTIIQGAGSFLEILDRNFDIWGTQAEKQVELARQAEAASQILYENVSASMSVFLKSLGLGRLSEYTTEELMGKQAQVTQTEKADISQLGIKLNQEQIASLSGMNADAILKMTMIQNPSASQKDKDIWNNLTNTQRAAIAVLNSGDFTTGGGFTYAQAAGLVEVIRKSEQSQYEITQELNRRSGLTGTNALTLSRGETDAKDYEDLKTILKRQQELSAGKLNDAWYWNTLYKDTMDRGFYRAMSESQKAELYVGYAEANNPSTSTTSTPTVGIKLAADGGITNSPTMISEFGQKEFVLPLDRPLSSQNRNILDELNSIANISDKPQSMSCYVDIKIDPTIPFNREGISNLAKEISFRIGENMKQDLYGRGRRIL